MELIQEKINAKYHIWKPFILRGEFGHTENIFLKLQDTKLGILFILFIVCIVSQMKDEKPVAISSGDSSAPEPSPFVPPAKPLKRDRPSTFSPTEDSFKDTANLVKEDSDV